jgi:hypothetical protein
MSPLSREVIPQRLIVLLRLEVKLSMTAIDISTMFTVSIYMYMFMPPILPNALHNYTARLHDGAVRFGGGHVRVS